MHGLLVLIQNKLSPPPKVTAHNLFLFFVVFTTIAAVMPGPTYLVGFLALLILISFIWFNSLSFSFFIVYLLTIFFTKPLYEGSVITFQDFIFYKVPKLISLHYELRPSTVIFVFLLLSSLPLLFTHLFRKKHAPLVNKILIMQFLQALLLLLFSIFSFDQSHIVTLATALHQTFLPVVLYGTLFSTSKKLLKSVIQAFAASTILTQGVIVLLQLIRRNQPLSSVIEHIYDPLQVATVETGVNRATGTLFHPNYMGVIIAMLLPLVFASLLKKMSAKERTLKMLAVVVGLALIFFSFSRWAWLVFFITLVTFTLTNYRLFSSKLKRVISLSVFVSAVLFFIFGIQRFAKFDTIQGRIEIAEKYTQLVADRPLVGWGPGVAELSLLPYRQDAYSQDLEIGRAHIFLLQLAADQGLVVTFFQAGSIALIMLHGVVSFRKLPWFSKSLFFGICIFVANSFAYSLYLDFSIELFGVLTAYYLLFVGQSHIEDLKLIPDIRAPQTFGVPRD